VPAWLAEGICLHLDIGVEIGRKGGGDVLRVSTACRFFRERLNGLARCADCPEFSPWQGEGSVDEELAGRDVDPTGPETGATPGPRGTVKGLRMMPGCFRIGVRHCLRSPELVPNWVVVVPPSSQRPMEPYRALVNGLLEEGGLQGLFFTGPLADVDALCDLCLAVQQSPNVVVDAAEWDAAAVFALAVAGALGRRLLLVRGQDSTPPFKPQGLPVYEYASSEDLAMLLFSGLGIQPGPAKETPPEEGSAGQEAPEQQDVPAEKATESPPGDGSAPTDRPGQEEEVPPDEAPERGEPSD
jgi:hypothetical protein